MADTTFYQTRPALKAIDLGETPDRFAVQVVAHVTAGTDSTFVNTRVLAEPLNNRALKAVNLGDGTYALGAVIV